MCVSVFFFVIDVVVVVFTRHVQFIHRCSMRATKYRVQFLSELNAVYSIIVLLCHVEKVSDCRSQKTFRWNLIKCQFYLAELNFITVSEAIIRDSTYKWRNENEEIVGMRRKKKIYIYNNHKINWFVLTRHKMLKRRW